MLRQDEFKIRSQKRQRLDTLVFMSDLKAKCEFFPNITCDDEITDAMKERIDEKLNDCWNRKIYGDIRKSILDIQMKVSQGELDGRTICHDLDNIMNLCQIMPIDEHGKPVKF